VHVTASPGTPAAPVPAPPEPAPPLHAPPLHAPPARPASGLVGALAARIAGDRQRGELEPWQEMSSQYLLDLAFRYQSGDATPMSGRLLEAGLTYLANAAQPTDTH